MGDLPASRLNTFQAAFETTGADLFGPINVRLRRGQSQAKRWIALFCCFVTRAIHLKKIDDLTSSSFINAVRRFQSRRGYVRTIRLDSATNHVGASNELSAAIREWNDTHVLDRSLRQRGIKFEFNPPAASHVGGVFEYCIRLCWKHIRHILEQQTVNDKALSTIIAEVEFIVNSRPLCPTSESPDDLQSISPNNFLMFNPIESLPPGIFVEQDQYLRRWRQIQYLIDLFWKRYIKEYMPLLNRRQKWIRPKRNSKVGDLVLIHDPNVPRVDKGCE